MYLPFVLSFRLTIVLFGAALFVPSSALAQDGPKQGSRLQAAAEIKKEREVLKGTRVHKLSKGMPLAAFSQGGEHEKELADFVRDQKVAGLLVVQDGKIRLERYTAGHGPSSPWPSFSVAKSVTSTLVGTAINDGFINSVDDYVTGYLPDLKGSAYDSVRIRHLLTMTAGIRWNESYTDPNGDIARLSADKIEPGMNATVGYMRRLPADAKPGKKFLYSTGETHLLGVLVSAATHQTLSAYLSAKIWKPYGMEQHASWTLDRTGQELAGCCLQMTLRDFARFGLFCLDEGHINGQSILARDWLKTATTIQVPLWPGGGYGYGWWIFNSGSFDALGIYGQRIHVDPSRRLVIVLNSAWPEAESNERQVAFAKFLALVNKALDREQEGTSTH